VRRSRLRTGDLLLGAASVALWIAAFQFLVVERSSILDDAFITLHLAANVVERTSARFSPITSSSALLASSPLRLSILALEKILSCGLGQCGRSELLARRALALSGPLTALVFLPFFWQRRRSWLVGFAASGALSLAFDSALQMEALLVFWTLYAFYILLEDLPKRPLLAGVLLGVAAIGRVEYAVALAFPLTLTTVLPWDHDSRARLVRAALGTAAVLGIWTLFAASLGVWPIPVSWLSKIATGRERLFGPSFGEVLPTFLGRGLFGDASTQAHAALGALVVASLGTALHVLRGLTRLRWCALSIHVVALLVLLRAPGNYVWYFESYVVGVASLLVASFVHAESLPGTGRHVARAATALALLAMLVPRLGFDPPFPWNFHDPESRAATYQTLARRHLGNGVFGYTSSEPPGHVRVCEIGIIAYFSGPSVWLGDICGLAQPGELAGSRSSFSRLFPESSLRTIQAEYAEVRKITGRLLEAGPIYAIGSGPGALLEARKNCHRVVVEPRICMTF
jgi:hypothetical protein